MKRSAAVIAAVAALAGCGTDSPDPVAGAATTTQAAVAPVDATTAPAVVSTEPAVVEYTPFEQVDPHLSEYFIALEATTLAADQGEERLYNLGLGVCRNLDGGTTIDQELSGLINDARLADSDAGSLVGAAVSDMCPQHGQLVEAYLAGDTQPAAPADAGGDASGCDPNYGGCVPVAADVDCAGGTGDGPAYVEGPVEVVGSDIYGLDPEGDGVGCDA